MAMTGTLTKYWKDFVSLVYPVICKGCGTGVPGEGQLLCWHCISHLPLTGFEHKRDNLAEDLFAGRLPLEKATAFMFFGKGSLVQHLVHAVKYKGAKELGCFLGTMMGQAMLDAGWNNEIDVIIPLPLNKKKELKRGFNQAFVIAEGIGVAMNKPVLEVAVIRSKFTETQTRKTREKRWENVGDVFALQDNHELENKHVLLVDDVVTTGATLEACGQVLLQVPGIRISIAALALASRI